MDYNPRGYMVLIPGDTVLMAMIITVENKAIPIKREQALYLLKILNGEIECPDKATEEKILKIKNIYVQQ